MAVQSLMSIAIFKMKGIGLKLPVLTTCLNGPKA